MASKRDHDLARRRSDYRMWNDRQAGAHGQQNRWRHQYFDRIRAQAHSHERGSDTGYDIGLGRRAVTDGTTSCDWPGYRWPMVVDWANWVAIAVSVVAIIMSTCGILYTQWKTGRRDIEQWRRNELWKLAANFLLLSTERESELLDYYESFFLGHRGPDRPVLASQKLWQMELLVQQIRLVDSRLSASAKAVYAAHRDADARAAAQDPQHGPMNEVEERLVPHLEDLHSDLVEKFQSVSGLRSPGRR